MPPPVADVAAIRRFCEERSADGVCLEAVESGQTVTIVERRPPWRGGPGADWSALEIARFRYTGTTGRWSLHWQDSNERWHRDDLVAPTADVARLIEHVDEDPTAIFWG